MSAGLLVASWVVFTQWGGSPVDAYSYWNTNPADPYRFVAANVQYPYPPVWIQVLSPLLTLPFGAFVAMIRAAEMVALLALAGPAAGVALVLPPVAAEVNAANVNLILVALAAFGFRWPILWAPVIVTKPSAAVGLLWFALRGEWRRLAIPVVVAGVAALLSFVYRPDLWFQWIAYLGPYGDTPGWPFPIPLWPRLPVALAFVVIGARTNRPWLAMLGSIVAWPKLYFQSISLLLGLLPVLGAKLVSSVREPQASEASGSVTPVVGRA